MTERNERTAVAVVFLLAVGVTLGALGVSAASTNTVRSAPNLTWVGDVSYDANTVSVAVPPTCEPPAVGNLTTYAFHNVTFSFRIADWCTPGGGVLNGTATEADGSKFHFGLTGIAGPTPYITWISTDRTCGVEWDRNVTALLLVRS